MNYLKYIFNKMDQFVRSKVLIRFDAPVEKPIEMAEKIEPIKKVTMEEPKKQTEFEYFKESILPHTLVWEGVRDISKGGKLHKVKNDSGGWTLWGIAYNKNRRLFKNLADFKDTTYDEASKIAFDKYYMAIRADLVPEQSKLTYFDIAYNMGNSRAIKYAQKCIGTTSDGKIGNITRRLLPNLKEYCLYKRRKSFYYYLARRNSKMKKFLKGWLRRTESINNQKY